MISPGFATSRVCFESSSDEFSLEHFHTVLPTVFPHGHAPTYPVNASEMGNHVRSGGFRQLSSASPPNSARTHARIILPKRSGTKVRADQYLKPAECPEVRLLTSSSANSLFAYGHWASASIVRCFSSTRSRASGATAEPGMQRKAAPPVTATKGLELCTALASVLKLEGDAASRVHRATSWEDAALHVFDRTDQAATGSLCVQDTCGRGLTWIVSP